MSCNRGRVLKLSMKGSKNTVEVREGLGKADSIRTCAGIPAMTLSFITVIFDGKRLMAQAGIDNNEPKPHACLISPASINQGFIITDQTSMQHSHEHQVREGGAKVGAVNGGLEL